MVSCFTKKTHRAYMYLLQGTVFTEDAESPYLAAKAQASFPNESFAPQTSASVKQPCGPHVLRTRQVRSHLQVFALPCPSASSIFLSSLLSSDSVGSRGSPILSIKLFPNLQGFFPPLNPTSSNNQYHSLLCVAVSLTGTLRLLDWKILKVKG